MLDASPHEEQSTAIKHMEKLATFTTQEDPVCGLQEAKQLALKAIRTAVPNEINELQTIRNQKAKAEETAINKWAERWYQLPRTSLAYRTALTKPPNGKPHPTFQHENTKQKEGEHKFLSGRPSQTREVKSNFSRQTVSTLYRFITDTPL
ncbi:hypothetical protein BC827DRAFT_1267469 [Russula dissimulans]|nr:hypothetical protein BC827DRAFT_1267469 [Russula dissimulans]